MSDISEDEAEPGILITAKDASLKPFYTAISKPALRAYLSTILVFLTGAALLGIAVTAYLLFYYSYIPTRGFSRPIYLQFDSGHHPHAIASLPRELVSNQHYDVKVILHMPRTSSNTGAGNLMLDLQLLAPTAPGVMGEPSIKAEVLAHETRPAILTYHSQTMEHIHRAAALPLYVVGLRHESEVLNVMMMEGIQFEKGWRNVPASARLELRSAKALQVYEAQVVFTARLHGLRYVMFNYRTISFLVLTSIFWTVEMTFAGFIWLALTIFVFPDSSATTAKKEETTPIKKEQRGDHFDEMSDTPHTFPTLSGQPPLRYSSPRIKKEEEQQDPPQAETQLATGEADDEDDDFILDEGGPLGRAVSDSGLGTSMESSSGRPDSMRRRSRMSSGGQ